MMTRINSRAKGASGERELAKKLIDLFKLDPQKTYRGCQFSGSPGSPDVKTEWDFWHIECKRVQRLNIEEAISQSIRDAGSNETPVVIHRKDRKEWLITLKLDDLMSLSEKIIEFYKTKKNME